MWLDVLILCQLMPCLFCVAGCYGTSCWQALQRIMLGLADVVWHGLSARLLLTAAFVASSSAFSMAAHITCRILRSVHAATAFTNSDDFSTSSHAGSLSSSHHLTLSVSHQQLTQQATCIPSHPDLPTWLLPLPPTLPHPTPGLRRFCGRHGMPPCWQPSPSLLPCMLCIQHGHGLPVHSMHYKLAVLYFLQVWCVGRAWDAAGSFLAILPSLSCHFEKHCLVSYSPLLSSLQFIKTFLTWH